MTDLLYVKQVVYDKGIRRGERHGLRRGKALGKVEGAADAKREMAKGLREDGVSMDIIVRRSGLSEDEIKAL